MKRNILLGLVLLGAFALSSCSTQQMAGAKSVKDDDVYFSEAKAGDAPVYVSAPQQPQQNRYNNYNDDDYYYYDSYASRINRFGYFSPFGYYNDIYAGYTPLYGYNNLGWGLGFNYGWGGYYNSPFYYGGYYGYNPFFYGGYNPYWGYNSIGIGYGWGYGGGYWGGYSTYGAIASRGNARPYRGAGAPNNAMVNRSVNNVGYNGRYPMNNAYPGRPQVINGANGGRQAVNSYGNQQQPNSYSRPTRTDAPRPSYNPPAVQSSPPPSSGGYSGGGSSGGGGGGGGGGARPVRP